MILTDDIMLDTHYIQVDNQTIRILVTLTSARSYNGNHGNNHHNDAPARPTSGYYEDDRYSERSYDRYTDR